MVMDTRIDHVGTVPRYFVKEKENLLSYRRADGTPMITMGDDTTAASLAGPSGLPSQRRLDRLTYFSGILHDPDPTGFERLHLFRCRPFAA